jgi:hypothetical protein
VTTKPGGTPYADDISMAASLPAGDHDELDNIGHGLMEYVVRLIVSLVTSNARVKYLIFDAVIRNPKFTTIIVDQARTGLADELRVRNTVVHEVDMKDIRFETVYGSRKVAAGSSRIAVFIGAVLGLLAGIWAMMIIDATPVAVNVVSQTASVGVSNAVDQPWFITIVLVVTTLIGAAFGGIKKRYEEVTYPKSVRAIYTENEES